MKNSLKRLSLVIIASLAGLTSFAWHDASKVAPSKPKHSQKVAGCAPATSSTVLELNNVRAFIETGGTMWHNRNAGFSGYEIPAGSGKTAIFSGSLWMAGVDANDQLKIAAAMFRRGNDFWTGPLDTLGSAEISEATCLEYDRFYTITKAEVEQFIAWFACNQNGGNCDPNYTIPNSILDWPAHGDRSKGQSYYLAPFYDNPAGPNPSNGYYDPENDGDYPYYDINGDIACNGNNRRITLKGDETQWWVFNDKGSIHTETGGDPIGMEIRAQAFAFATNDEINNMTFYNYEMINRGTQTLFDTYFAQFVDADVGSAEDDFVGVDVARGLGYAYNGDGFDEDANGILGYGSTPPAIGVDFFEGPFQDPDGEDNLIYDDVELALANGGIVYPGLGIGYGDGVVDNERFGMRKFIYFNRSDGVVPDLSTDPEADKPGQFYNYMRGFWKNGDPLTHGGTGYSNPTGLQASYMFPGDSDPLHFGTEGIDPGNDNWSEQGEGNFPFDRRFLQSAGPFTLEPGAVNNITVGVVYARSTTGDPFASVELLRIADDKAQALFDNCFKIVEGPDAPNLTIQELDKELLFTIEPGGNNANEDFVSIDPTIPESATQTITTYVPDPNNPGSFIPETTTETIEYDRAYRFQGYQVFQLKDATISSAELHDPNVSRLVFQCDIKDDVERLINFNFDEDLNASVPIEQVDGENDGIKHTFNVTDDMFSTGDRRLVNHKTYYYMAVAYSHNNFKRYDQNDPALLDGQKKPYLESRKSTESGKIKTWTGIPHIPAPELNGTIISAAYGDQPEITRIEGQGNGGLDISLTFESEKEILAGAPWKVDHPTYRGGNGPITVKVIDPLMVSGGQFTVKFLPDTSGTDSLDEANWVLIDHETGDVIPSDKSIRVGNEQVFADYGFSINIEQYQYNRLPTSGHQVPAVISASIEYSNPQDPWLGGVPDVDGQIMQNWIRSGTVNLDPVNDPDGSEFNDHTEAQGQEFRDGDQVFEQLLGGTWAPYQLTAWNNSGPAVDRPSTAWHDLDYLQGVDIVFTDDKSKWTRCPVIEMGDDPTLTEGGVNQFRLRQTPSVDKDFLPDASGTTGMSWFPGYAINVETGERLNLAFGEHSWLAADHGRDMQFNPTGKLYDELFNQTVFGGFHYLWVFGNERGSSTSTLRMPHYDEGAYAYENLSINSPGKRRQVFRSAMWVGLPIPQNNAKFLGNTARVKLRVSKPYETYETTLENKSNPQYEFGMDDFETETQNIPAAEDALALVNVVPNPYYAYSAYEVNRLDNRIKIVNLPDRCTVKIYSVNGTLVRTFQKDNAITSLDWDLKNEAQVPIASGVYLIHVNAPGIGEKVVKWFGAVRPADLENF